MKDWRKRIQMRNIVYHSPPGIETGGLYSTTYCFEQCQNNKYQTATTTKYCLPQNQITRKAEHTTAPKDVIVDFQILKYMSLAVMNK